MKRKMTEISTTRIFSFFVPFSFFCPPAFQFQTSLVQRFRRRGGSGWWWVVGMGVKSRGLEQVVLTPSLPLSPSLVSFIPVTLMSTSWVPFGRLPQAESLTEVSPSLWVIGWITDSLSTEPCNSAAIHTHTDTHTVRVSMPLVAHCGFYSFFVACVQSGSTAFTQ